MTATVYALGDSITYGFPYGPQYSWVHLVSQATGHRMVNGGVNGDTTSFMVRRLATALEAKPSHLILLGGTNDAYWGQPFKAVAANIMEICRKTAQHGTRVILGLPIPVDDVQVNSLIADYRAFMQDYAFREGYLTIPFHHAFLDGEGRFKTELTTDGCHPNIDGYEAMAECAEKVLYNIP